MLTLLSTFVGVRSASAVYPDIMGCELGCSVAATGWPLTFVRDYLGMSVVNTADITEVWFAADRFDWQPFVVNVAVWSIVLLAANTGLPLLNAQKMQTSTMDHTGASTHTRGKTDRPPPPNARPALATLTNWRSSSLTSRLATRPTYHRLRSLKRKSKAERLAGRRGLRS